MSSYVKKVASNIRRNHLIVFAFIGWAIIIFALMSELDRQYYQAEKKDYIHKSWDQFVKESVEENTLVDLGKKILNANSTTELKAYSKELLAHFRTIVEGDNIVIRLALLGKDEVILSFENKEKYSAFNSFENSLFFRNFTTFARRKISGTDGLLEIAATTPRNIPAIEKMTALYRWWALWICLLVTFIFWYMFKYLLLPVRRVMSYLDKAHTENPQIIRRPKALLEKEYNNLGRDALITKLNQNIHHFVSTTRSYHPSDVCAKIPDIVRDYFEFRSIFICQIRQSSEADTPLIDIYGDASQFTKKVRETFTKEFLKHLSQHKVFLEKKEWCGRVLYWEFDEKNIAVYLDTVFESKLEGTIIVAIIPYLSYDRYFDEWLVETCRQIAEQVKRGLTTLEVQRRLVFREKSEANINLSRNLGHDLTNSIATSKLDILSIRDYLQASDSEKTLPTKREQLLRESIEGLLNNTKLLQELVNIYRSFSFIKHPKFERIDVPLLLDEILNIFRLSLSQTVIIETAYGHNVPKCNVEQRLLKLAVFNLLTNAYEAIRRQKTDRDFKGMIGIKILHHLHSDEVEISITDNGSGIVNQQGKTLTPDEIDKLFLSAYSTKSDDDEGGLGLSWVWTIINDFHKGRVTARNNTTEGATFSIFLKPNLVLDEEMELNAEQSGGEVV